MTYKSRIAKETKSQQRVVSFGVKDSKGREIGAQIRTWETDFESTSPEAKVWYAIKPGHYFSLYAQATRGGKAFGASQSTHYFTIVSARNAAIEKYLAQARKRAGKIKR